MRIEHGQEVLSTGGSMGIHRATDVKRFDGWCRFLMALSLALGLGVLMLTTSASAAISTGDGASAWQNPLPPGDTLMSVPSPVATAASAVRSLRSGSGAAALLALEQAQLTAPKPARYGQFGGSVALSGDTALVSGRCKSGGGAAGAVYVFTRSGTSWSQQAKLSDPGAAGSDWFGSSVALSGDTALITGGGAVYVFVRTGTSWSQQAELTPSDGTAYSFWLSIAVSGDTALVGTYGAAYVFTRSGTSWSQQAELSDPETDPVWADNDCFGASTALYGDTAVVGASGRFVGDNNVGAAYIYTRTGTSWSPQAELTADDGAMGDAFGYSVALSDDTVLVAAKDKTVGGQQYAGAAYVFTRSGTSWSQQAELTASDAAKKDYFGASVAFAGDTALIGAWHEHKPVGGRGIVWVSGAAYVFTRTAGSWLQQAELPASPAATGQWACGSVALCGDTALVGTPLMKVGSQIGAGVAHVCLLTAMPSLSLKAVPLSLRVGEKLTFNGLVNPFLVTVKTAQIERRVGGKLTALKTLTLTTSGAFKCAMKPNKVGKWVFVAAYRVGKLTFLSKPVTVKVHT
jgi:hypothetical protein